MNQLSWLIYLADIANDANSVCAFIFFGGIISLAVYSLGKGICHMANYDFEENPRTPSIAKVSGKFWLPVAMAGAIGILTPSSTTIYAIAASQMGQDLMKSPTATKAIKALDAWLDKQIKAKP